MEHRVDGSLRALRRILRAAEAASRSLSRATGMTAPQLAVMRILCERGEQSPKAIAQTVGVAQGTATALIDKLEQRGFVTRRRGEIDRRQILVAPTPAGSDAFDAAPDPLHVRVAHGLTRMEPWEQAMILSALERVALLMDASDDAAAPLLHSGDIAGPGHDGPA